MRKPIQSSPQFNHFKSFDKIASAMMEKWPDVFKRSEDNGITTRSLSAKIGELNRGKTTWWLKRKVATDCLIELLSLDRDELGLDQKTGRHIFDLPTFPDCPPLDLTREDGWEIARSELLSEEYPQINEPFASALYTKPTLDAWLSPQCRIDPYEKTEWLYVPDPTEYLLLTRKLEVRGRHQFASHNSLSEAIVKDADWLYNPQPLILAIRGIPEASDLEKLINARQSKPLLVISQSPLPDLDPEKINEEQLEQIKRVVKSWIRNLTSDWRTRLTQWVEERWQKEPMTGGRKWDETNFCSAGAQGLLNKLDPSGKWFVGVEDVLTLCQAVSMKNGIEVNALASNDEPLLQLFNPDESGLGLTILEQLIERRWKHWELTWNGELAQKVWSDMTRDLCQFETLLTQNLVARGVKGFDFQRPILIRLLLRSQLMAAFNKGDLAAWAPACFDNQRRPLVDAVLDTMNIDQLKQIAAQLIEATTTAATIGAGEALFSAIGRRIIREEGIDKKDIGGELLMLADHVLKQLTWNNGIPCPYSRPLTSTEQQLEWVCVCWAWSLEPSPGTDLPPNWYFPGWYPEKLPQTVPDWLNSIASSFFSQDMIMPMQDFLSVITRWLANHETPPTFEKMPPLFYAGLLALAAKGQWPACPDWWWIILGNRNAEQTLLHQVESAVLSVDRRTVALAWWPSLVKHQRQKFENNENLIFSSCYSRNFNERGYSELLSWVITEMDKQSDSALNGLDDKDKKFLMQYPAALPTSVKRQLLKSLAENFPKDWHPIPFLNFFPPYGPETTTEMEAFLDNDTLGDQAARCLWEWAPLTAEPLLKKRDCNRKALRRLILAIPSSSAIGDAVALLRDDPALLSDKERRDWTRRFLPDARQYAQDLLQLLNTKTEE